jgi:membrane fusion protein (multidrug efflux system)
VAEWYEFIVYGFSVTTIQAKNYQPSIQIVGTLSAIHGVTLKAATSGEITAIHFESNDEVKAGQLLVEVNPDQLKAELASSQAQLVKDKLTFARDKQLISHETISQSTYDEDRASYQQSIAAVQQAQAALDQAMITAPFSGKMGIRQVQVGDYLTAGDTIANIVQLNPLWVDFNVPTKYLAQVSMGQSVEVQNEAFANQSFSGKVSAIAPEADSNSDSFTVRATINNPNEQLLPGQLVNVTLLTGEATKTITIPAIAVLYNDKGSFVYKVSGKKANLVPVTIGDQVGQDIIIKSGLRDGDTIIVAGMNKIHGNSGNIQAVQ